MWWKWKVGFNKILKNIKYKCNFTLKRYVQLNRSWKVVEPLDNWWVTFFFFYNKKWWSCHLTNFLLFICQCWSCSRGLLQLFLFSASLKPTSMSIGSVRFSSPRALFSCSAGKVVQSRGLQRPKSESFMWPFLSNRRLSGLMSLERQH